MIRTKIIPLLMSAGLLLGISPAVLAQEGRGKDKKEKEYKEKKDKKVKDDHDRYEGPDRYRRYEDDDDRRDKRVEQRRGGTLGGILGKVVLPPAGFSGPRQLQGVPKGHYPPPGQCRIWYPNRPAGHQPPPTDCDNLRGVRLERGAFVLHGDRAYDAEYDWRGEERRRPGSVGRDILDILFPSR